MPTDLLDVTGEDVALLDDKQLRALIGRLCEAEVERAGMPRTAVTWGGHQDSQDDGVDVRVELPLDQGWCGSIPRSVAIFQSKATKMLPAEIRKEMRRKGALLSSISEVLRRGGAYVIVSNTSVSDRFLSQRKAAMEAAVLPEFSGHIGILDFYDSSRLASWVRIHPEVVLWLRSTIGKPMRGWKSWEQLHSVHNSEFLFDEGLRLRTPAASEESGMKVVEGIAALRDALRPEGACVRLAGLSGYGKTRLVVALFEEVVGGKALSASKLVYADVSDEPTPSPLEMCHLLHVRGGSNILVVDNCPPDLHAGLTKYVKESKSPLRLLTVEYDVRDDGPEETEIFRLDPSSDELIERLLRSRFPTLAPGDPGIIANFAGGNARVAIALAKTVEKGERLKGLNDAELFRRLFEQRHGTLDEVLRVAQCCSLLYSFQHDASDAVFSDEILALAELAGVSPDTFYRHVQQLHKRDLLQRRSIWAAILPHAIANRLAKDALDLFPRKKVEQVFKLPGRERMLKSFARRLGYLEESPVAQEIVKEWLAPGGMLGALQELDAERFSWFERIAPIAESRALDTYDRAFKAAAEMEQTGYLSFVQHAERILRLLAYQPENFAKSIDLLRVYIAWQDDAETRKRILERFSGLFTLRFSGTMATPDAKRAYLKNLFQKAVTDSDREIALGLVKSALANPRYLYLHDSDFGCRVRSFGYQVGSSEEFVQWYRNILRFVEERILSGAWDSAAMRTVLEKTFQDLWESCGVKADLESVAVRLNESVGWIEGFNAVRSTIRHGKRFGGTSYSAEDFQRLEQLERRLRPLDLASHVRLVVSPGYRIRFEELDELEKGQSASYADVDASIGTELMQVGGELALDLPTLEGLLPELVDQKFPKSWRLMLGVVNRVEDARAFWTWVEACLSRLEPQEPSFNFVGGVVQGLLERDATFAQELLDRMVEHPLFGKILPLIQIQLPLDSGATSRLVGSVRAELAPVWHFLYLGTGRRHESLDDDQLIEILDAILKRTGGGEVVLDVLGMRFHGLNEKAYRPGPNLVRFSQQFLMQLGSLATIADHHAQTLVSIVLDGDLAYEPSVAFARHLAGIHDEKLFLRDLRKTFQELARRQPRSILDGFLMSLDPERRHRPGYTDSPSSPSMTGFDDPFEEITDDLMEEWCRLDPEDRLPRLFRHVRLYRYDPSQARVVWRQFVLPMVAESQMPLRLLDLAYAGFHTSHWSGSAADIFAHYVPLVRDLHDLGRTEINDWARKKLELLDQQISSWREFHDRAHASGTRGFE